MIPIGLKLSVALVLLFGFACHHVAGVCRVELCTNSTRCVLSADRRRCRCASGYYADQCDKNADIKVMCGKDFMAIRAKEDYFRYHNVPLESLHLPNKSCRPERTVIGGELYYMAKISKDDYQICGGKPLMKKNRISYSLSMQSDPQVRGNIIRNPVIKMDFTCVYPSIRTVSLPFPVLYFSSEMVMHVEEVDAKIHMMLYTDQSYSQAYTSSPTIELRDKVYVEVAVTEPADFFLLRVEKCWATQSPQPNSTEGLSYTLVQNGCVSDETLTFLNTTAGQSGRNGESSTIRYSFDMFHFMTEPHDLYLHCTVELCVPEDHLSCSPNCNSISKREAVRAEPSVGLLSYGPIKIEMSKRPEFSILATVVLPVAGVWTMGFFLIILITVFKAGSKRLTRQEQP
ncbi:zona pellucida glycoprotein d [Pseudoliparis swirei]|uniref:zona pellucida glycoprotein d n=1 Tax=Pseudoliparis swirei TaxID=2059687 RepID=UPI0024BEDCDD|nr:zona pellucida glycoprotein d [Pseudoliparis swirei]